MNHPPESFVCVDCGGTAHLIAFLPEDTDLVPGMSLAYRCGDCLERFDVVWEEDDEEDD